jgi:cytochrome b-561
MASSTLMYRILPFEHKKKKIIHFILHTLGIVSVTLGLTAIIINKGHVKHVHFTSVHSWLGIGVYSIFVLSYFSSLLMFLCPKASAETRAKTISFHRMGGEILFILSGIVCLLGMQKMLSPGSGTGQTKLGDSIVLHVVLAIILVKVSLYNHNKPVSYEKVNKNNYDKFETNQ